MAFKRPPEDDAKPNLTPMIDMTFLLVVFFMLTIDLTQKEFVPVDLPFAASGVEDKENKDIPRLTVNLLNSGDIKLKGNTYKLATGVPEEQRNALVALRNELSRLTAASEFREPDKSSMIPVMIHGDRAARWQYVQWIMQVCAEPTIGVYKIQFAVKGPAPEGAEEE